MTTRAEHLAWAKERALAELETSGKTAAIASMMQDLTSWEGGAMYDDMTFLSGMMLEAGMFRNSDAEMRAWIDGFN